MRTKTGETILELLKTHGKLRVHELIPLLHISHVAVHKQIKKLMDAGKIQKIGTPPRVMYTLSDAKDERSTIPTSLPPELYKYFWDVDPKKVNPQQSPEYVAHRLLDKGGLDAARWALRAIPRKLLVGVVKYRRDFSPRNSTFWSRYFQIPEKEVACLQPSYLAMRRQHWPY